MVVARIDDEYGLEIPQLYVVNVSVPAEVEQALDARTSVGVIGDLHAFQSYQLSRSLPAAAANPAGGLAGAGVGVGMGMALAQRFGEGAAPGTATPPPPPSGWHLVEAGRSVGPFSLDELSRAVAQGRLTPDTMVWSSGFRDWVPARSVPALAALFGATPPPVPQR